MEKIFNDFSVVGAFIGGILSFIFGKPDVLIYAYREKTRIYTSGVETQGKYNCQ